LVEFLLLALSRDTCATVTELLLVLPAVRHALPLPLAMAEQPQPSSSSSGSTEQAIVHTIYTIGHSKRPIEQLVSMLQEHGVRLLADIRTLPRSRWVAGSRQQAGRARLVAH
jgi:hypothetical protein